MQRSCIINFGIKRIKHEWDNCVIRKNTNRIVRMPNTVIQSTGVVKLVLVKHAMNLQDITAGFLTVRHYFPYEINLTDYSLTYRVIEIFITFLVPRSAAIPVQKRGQSLPSRNPP